MVELEYRDTGSGPGVLLLHGLFGSANNWSRHARELAATHRVITPDLRNHGRSPHAAGMDYRELADDVLALLPRLGLESVALVGHSLGGKVAMTCALQAPESVRRLMVVDIAPRRYPARQSEVFSALQSLELQSLQDRADADRRLAPRITEPEVRAFLLTNLVQGADGYGWRMNLAELAAHAETIEGFPRFDAPYPGPVLFVRGSDSDYLDPDDDGDPIAALFPSARIETIDGAGHWVHAERPEAFAERLRAFVDGDP